MFVRDCAFVEDSVACEDETVSDLFHEFVPFMLIHVSDHDAACCFRIEFRAVKVWDVCPSDATEHTKMTDVRFPFCPDFERRERRGASGRGVTRGSVVKVAGRVDGFCPKRGRQCAV